jgi:hypothetical protein
MKGVEQRTELAFGCDAAFAHERGRARQQLSFRRVAADGRQQRQLLERPL